MARAKRVTLMQQVQERLYSRQVALKNGCVGLVPVCCGECGRPIATTAPDRERGEPPILFDFPEAAKGWTCTDCAGPWPSNANNPASVAADGAVTSIEQGAK